MIKNDAWIAEKSSQGMIAPFESSLIRKLAGDANTPERLVISYGLSSYGYDIRLSSKEFRIFRHIPGTVIDPKNFSPKNLEAAELHTDINAFTSLHPSKVVALEKQNQHLQRLLTQTRAELHALKDLEKSSNINDSESSDEVAPKLGISINS
jgi:deoxycytidine triphosphate deaminase